MGGFLLRVWHFYCYCFNSSLRTYYGGCKAIYLKTSLVNSFQQVAGVCPADEVALRPLGLEGVCQRQAAHDVAAAHLQ